VSISEATKVSKCHYEGDFTVYCNKTKLPSSKDTKELIRSAEVISGVQHNDTLCSYMPSAGCARKTKAPECVDKASCNVKNGWHSLEPYCPGGRSYYTQLEYDCQPAYFMCDKQELVTNGFSGLIYSPSYPNSFRTDKSEPCYMTIELPDNHHAEITFDNFEMMKTSNCMGDYLEILEYRGYKDSGASMAYGEDDGYLGKLTHSRAQSELPRRKRQVNSHLAVDGDDTGAISHNSDELKEENKANKSSKSNDKTQNSRVVNLNSRLNKRRPSFKWHSLGHFCGKFDSGYTFRATANIINFKFRPLASNHQFMSTYQHRANFRFKIYFQGKD
jgi:hypothetical protein